MEEINFTTNWNNKLENKCFTTIRLKTNRFQIGQTIKLYLKESDFGLGKIVDIKVFRLFDLTDFNARIDTGYPREETISLIQKIYSKAVFDWEKQEMQLMLIERIKKSPNEQTKLFQ